MQLDYEQAQAAFESAIARVGALLDADSWIHDPSWAPTLRAIEMEAGSGPPPRRRVSIKFLARAVELLALMELNVTLMERRQEREVVRIALLHQYWFHWERMRRGLERTVAGLKAAEREILTPYHEGDAEDPEVKQFWGAVADAGLSYKRENMLENLLAQDGIRTHREYQYADLYFDVLQAHPQIGPERHKRWMIEFLERKRGTADRDEGGD